MQLLRLRDVVAKTGLSATQIYVWMSDGLFPRPVRIGRRAVAWVASELDAWIEAQAQKPRVEVRRRRRSDGAKAAAI
jgi:prophage regulatory protein